MRRSLGKMSKRSRLLRRKSKLGATKLLQNFELGDIVHIDLQTGYSGMPHPRYRGRSGSIVGKRGEAYVVEIQVMRAKKRLTIPAVHLRK
jgi:large subunit ribosomal protein L21e